MIVTILELLIGARRPEAAGSSGAAARGSGPFRLPLWLLLAAAFGATCGAADLEEAERLFRSGRYGPCIRAVEKGVEDQPLFEEWWHLKIRAELERGLYGDALTTLAGGLAVAPSSMRLRLLGRTVYLFNNQPQHAERMLAELASLARRWRIDRADAADRIAMGRFFLLRGADARQVLEIIYDRVKKDTPDFLETYLATGELALEKHDYALAAQAYERAAELAPGDPAAHCGIARAYGESDPERARSALERALSLNPRHVDSLLLEADTLIDAEDYEGAEEILELISEVNAARPEACALRAVLAHLEGKVEEERKWREAGLAHWPGNPVVDHLIGRKLSQKYRFAEAAAHQRCALSLDPSYLPAKIQLSQDLLRLGDEAQGWRLAGEVYEGDAYDVVAFNLITLKETLSKFKTVVGEGLVVRMDAREADLYGTAALEVLARARRVLCGKYDVTLDRPIVVEIFPEQKDFAVRTFGLPGGAGFLGVCFGSVITANSPAAQGGRPSNWQAVLWHEFCHAVTLAKTRNKMPRWLSEGISVYEETQANPAWGQAMTPRYRSMILDGELPPVSRLSAAFLSPPSPFHLQFAYYASCLAVEYLVVTYGNEALKSILDDLGSGAPIETALERRAAPLDALDAGFAAFARARAEALVPAASWEVPDLPPDADVEAVARWNAEHPDSYPGLLLLAERLLAERRWEEARAPLERLVTLYPGDVGPESPYRLLAEVHRRRDDAAAEREALSALGARAADAVDVYMRLMELCAGTEDWECVVANAERMLAVNPLHRAPYRYLAKGAHALGDGDRAVRAYRALLRMDPVNPADAHMNLARMLLETGDVEGARRHVLAALEEAPRFRAAHRLLLEVAERRRAAAPAEEKP